MKLTHRLLLLAALIAAEMLCAQPAVPADGAGPRRGGPGGPGRFHPILRTLDADHDGEISAAELAGAPAALAALDRSGDGTVTRDELHPARPQPPAGARRGAGPGGRPADPVMLALDADADGALSATEIAGATTSLSALDANRDGKLTRDEFRPLPPVE